jgi:hypothetical protein
MSEGRITRTFFIVEAVHKTIKQNSRTTTLIPVADLTNQELLGVPGLFAIQGHAA